MAQVIVIPARLASQRFPGKLLEDATGWPLIRHVYERCAATRGVDRVVVAADGEMISAAVQAFGGEVVLTDPDLPSGTDRVARAAALLGLDPERDLVVNVQGDEPLIDPAHLEMLFRLLGEAADAAVVTLAARRTDRAGFEDPNRVKVVLDRRGYALYFSRAPIPSWRAGDAGGGADATVPWLCHVGVYGFRPEALERFAAEPPAPSEERERLEQLRFLEMGLRIRVGVVESAAPGIDTRADYERFVGELKRSGEG